MSLELKTVSFDWRSGCDYQLLRDGESYFPSILTAIQTAKQYVFIELYLVESSQALTLFIQVIERAVQGGAQVFVLLDDYGSLGLNEPDRQRLEQSVTELAYYNPLSSTNSLRNLYRILRYKIGYDLHRDHRKLVLVDGQLAFIGGFGVTDEFYNTDKPALNWRENVIRVEGPVVEDWDVLFRQTWQRCSNRAIELDRPGSRLFDSSGYARVLYSESGLNNDIRRQLRKRLSSAEHRIWLCTAYFLPSWRFIWRLRRAARNNVDVRLLLPGSLTDHPVVRHAGRRHYYRLLQSGVRIFEYQPRVLHAKTLLCDAWVTLGSVNFDHWGLRWNLEANLDVEDHQFTKLVEQMFEDDFAQSLEITLDSWHQRTWYQRLLEWFWGWVDTKVAKVTNRLKRH